MKTLYHIEHEYEIDLGLLDDSDLFEELEERGYDVIEEGTMNEFIRRQQSNYWEVRSIDALITLWEEYNINISFDETIEALKERKQNRENYTEVLETQMERARQEESEEMIDAIRTMEAVA